MKDVTCFEQVTSCGADEHSSLLVYYSLSANIELPTFRRCVPPPSSVFSRISSPTHVPQARAKHQYLFAVLHGIIPEDLHLEIGFFKFHDKKFLKDIKQILT